jgi:hypothetical protein
MWNTNLQEQRRAEWLHDQLLHQLKWGFISLTGNAINQGNIKIIEYPPIARITDQRVGDHVYVMNLYQWIFKTKGVNQDSLEICRLLALARIFKKASKIPTIAEVMADQKLKQAGTIKIHD